MKVSTFEDECGPSSGTRTLLGALAPRLSRYFAGPENYAIGCQTRGPRSTWPQSIGMPASSLSDPPPHLRPFILTMRPQMAFWTGMTPNPTPMVMSTPVAGQDL